MIEICESNFPACVSCGRKPNIEIGFGVLKIDLCNDCAEMLGSMLADEYEEEE